MAYIARTDGGSSVLELRTGTLADIPEADRANWRSCFEVRPTIDPATRSWSGPTLTVNGDGSQVNLVWTATDPAPAWVQLKLRTLAADVRYQKEIAGLVLPSGLKIATDRDSQAKIQQALDILEKGWVPSLDWKTSSGWVTLDLDTMTGIAQAVMAHVQGCFSAEKALLEAIAAGTVTTSADVNAYPWP